MTPRRHTATGALNALAGRWFTDEDLADLRLIGRWLMVCAGACVLALVLSALGPALDQFDAWRAQAREQHRQAAAQERHARGEREVIAWVQGHCGQEAWWKPRADGALVCTDKHGRTSTRQLVGAQP